MNKCQSLACVLVILLLSLSTKANETEQEQGKADNTSQIITIETATIRGNQELPTVLYLVPWQAPDVNALAASQTTEIIKPNIEMIDRDSFKRLINYYESR